MSTDLREENFYRNKNYGNLSKKTVTLDFFFVLYCGMKEILDTVVMLPSFPKQPTGSAI